jgi:hypothetical protein
MVLDKINMTIKTQVLTYLAASDGSEEVSFGDLSYPFQIIKLAPAKSLHHKCSVSLRSITSSICLWMTLTWARV